MLGHKTIPAMDSSRGGIEVVVEELAPRLVEMGCEVTCYNRTGCDNGGLKEYKGVKLIPVPTFKCKGLAAITSSFFAAIKATFGHYDVIHFHAEGPCFWIWIPAIFCKKRCCVATIHGIDHYREKWHAGLGSHCIKIGEKMAVKYASEIIVLSKGVQEYFREVYGRETVFIPNGVSRPKVRKAKEITEKFGLEKDDYILFLGRIVPEKGLRYLVEAYGGLKTEKKLVIAGGSSDTDEFTVELKKLAGDEVIFTGFVAGRLREELYSNAYVYVLPSDLEGMPLSLLEAMSYGNCCVVSNISECTEVVEDRAVVFKKGDLSDLEKKMQMLCDNSELVDKYKRESADYICSKYSWEDVTKKTLELYREI
ncbi:MAG: glycosyltransferase family 4 protein [Lachnospiraceae bacterium]|nr:glycosyltransferase family 4 protein [Lachnospiraceae bacterium]